MDKTRFSGAANQIKGRAEEILGRLLHNSMMVSHGKTTRLHGKVLSKISEAKDSLKIVFRKSSDF